MKTLQHNSSEEWGGGEFEQCSPSSLSKSKKQPLSAKAKAVAFLARREHSQKELLQKLLKHGYSESEAQEAIAWAMSKQFQSDARFGQSLARRRASNYGDRAIQAELSQHGVSSEMIRKPQLAEGEDSMDDSSSVQPEHERAYAWLQRRYSGSLGQVLAESNRNTQELLNMKAKAMRALSARGFEFDNIHRAWKRLLLEFESDA